MYKGISEGLAVLMGLSVMGATAARAAPLTGHDISITISPSNSATPIVVLNKTVDAFLPEATSADDPFFDNLDFIDIGPDFIQISTDGIGNGPGLYDIEFEIDAPGNFVFDGSFFPSGSIFVGGIQLLDERILLEDVAWTGGLTITGLSSDVEAPSSDVPLPGSMALLGIGLVGIGLRSWDSFVQRSVLRTS